MWTKVASISPSRSAIRGGRTWRSFNSADNAARSPPRTPLSAASRSATATANAGLLIIANFLSLPYYPVWSVVMIA
ncbi:hypothetical protein ACFXKH_23655, partial [Streptomyces caelestis]